MSCNEDIKALTQNYRCERKAIFFEGSYREVLDAVINIHDGQKTVEIIEILPYVFIINYELGYTRVDKIISRGNYGQVITGASKQVLKVNAIIDFPWADREKVISRLKTLIVFS